MLPNFGNMVASLGDGAMAAITAYIIDILTIEFVTNLPSLYAFAILIALGEYFFHAYLVKTEEVAPNTQ